MGRPRKDQEGPSAYESLEQAFWDLLEEKSFRSITVRDLTAKAKVNRNTFYYHFESIEDLAFATIRRNVPRELFGRLLAMLSEGCFDASFADGASDLETRFRRIRLIVRDGSLKLPLLAKQEVFSFWLDDMGVSEDELTKGDWACIDFIWGGVTSLIASDQVHNHQEYLEALEGGVASAVSLLIMRVRQEHGLL